MTLVELAPAEPGYVVGRVTGADYLAGEVESGCGHGRYLSVEWGRSELLDAGFVLENLAPALQQVGQIHCAGEQQATDDQERGRRRLGHTDHEHCDEHPGQCDHRDRNLEAPQAESTFLATELLA